MKFENILNLFLIFVPISFWLELTHANPVAVFICTCLAIIPLAGLMGKATEHLAEKLGEGIGGLLNATFGNAAELIIALIALHKGLFDVVKASITGSIIGNALLVLGLSMAAGGLKHNTQRFNSTAISASATLLLLSAIALVIPAVFHYLVAGKAGAAEQNLSLEISIVLFIAYILSLIFSLKTHKALYTSEAIEGAEEAMGTHGWSVRKASSVLVAATIMIAIMAEFLVGAIEPAAKTMGFTDIFVGVIIVAVIGNAAEHSTAILMAMKNKMDLAVHIAIGSSVQVALLLAPVLVFASYAFGTPMDLVFSPLEVLAVFVSVIAVAQVVSDGESNWLEGVLLLAVYIILGIAFYQLPAH